MAEQTSYTAGNVELDTAALSLTGPRGNIHLTKSQFAIAEALFRRAGNVITSDALSMAVWPDPDEEPETSNICLRQWISHLRIALFIISSGDVQVRIDRGVGWSLSIRKDRLVA